MDNLKAEEYEKILDKLLEKDACVELTSDKMCLEKIEHLNSEEESNALLMELLHEEEICGNAERSMSALVAMQQKVQNEYKKTKIQLQNIEEQIQNTVINANKQRNQIYKDLDALPDKYDLLDKQYDPNAVLKNIDAMLALKSSLQEEIGMTQRELDRILEASKEMGCEMPNTDGIFCEDFEDRLLEEYGDYNENSNKLHHMTLRYNELTEKFNKLINEI